MPSEKNWTGYSILLEVIIIFFSLERQKCFMMSLWLDIKDFWSPAASSNDGCIISTAFAKKFYSHHT